MTDGGILPNACEARDASPLLSRALTAAVDAYDRERQAAGPREPLTPSHKAALRPLIASAVEAYMNAICRVRP